MILAPAEAVFGCELVMHPCICLICLGFLIFFSHFLHAHLPGVTPPVVPLFCSQHEYPWQGGLHGITCLEASLFTPLPCIVAALVLCMWPSRA